MNYSRPEIQSLAAALLATSRHVMTGLEIAICEHASEQGEVSSHNCKILNIDSDETIFEHLLMQRIKEVTEYQQSMAEVCAS